MLVIATQRKHRVRAFLFLFTCFDLIMELFKEVARKVNYQVVLYCDILSRKKVYTLPCSTVVDSGVKLSTFKIKNE